MGDLQCSVCGIKTTYADAAIANYNATCNTHDGKHDWKDISYATHGMK